LTAAAETAAPAGMTAAVVTPSPVRPTIPDESARTGVVIDGAPTCAECGMLMTPNGGCYKCENCGSTSGCS
jgi:ribonucleoside-diphosphate reductase alpha chain